MHRETYHEQIKVLLVEDNPGDARLIREMLADVQATPSSPPRFALTHAGRLATALEHLADESFDVVLLDLGLPDCSGLDSFTKTHAHAPGTPIVVLTGLRDEQLAVQAMQAGAQDYLVKGQISGEVLVRALRYAIERQRMRMELQRNEERIRTIIEEYSDGIVILDREGVVCFTNPAAAEMFGRPAAELVGEPFGCPVSGAEEVEIDILRNGRPPGIAEMRVRETEWQGKHVFLASLRDVTERKRMEEALQRRNAILEAVRFAAEEFLRTNGWDRSVEEMLSRLGEATQVSRVYVFENHTAEDGCLLTSQRYEWVRGDVTAQLPNPGLQDFALCANGFQRWEEVLGQGRVISGHVRNFPASEQTVLATQNIKSIVVVPIFVDDAWWGFIGFDECDDEREWSTAEVKALKTAAGILGAAVQRKRTDRRLHYLATHDPLTSLPNRTLFRDRLKHALSQAQRNHQELAVIFLDLDHYKEVNDTVGHGKGDRVLREVATRLRNHLRRSDTIARLGGDEFAVILEDLPQVGGSAVVAQKILDSLAEPFVINGNEFYISASIGISLYPEDGRDVETLLSNADAAMYRAKENRNCYAFYSLNQYPDSALAEGI